MCEATEVWLGMYLLCTFRVPAAGPRSLGKWQCSTSTYELQSSHMSIANMGRQQ